MPHTKFVIPPPLHKLQPKIVHNARDEIAEFVAPLRKEIKDSWTRQGMQNMYTRGLNKKGLAEREEKT